MISDDKYFIIQIVFPYTYGAVFSAAFKIALSLVYTHLIRTCLSMDFFVFGDHCGLLELVVLCILANIRCFGHYFWRIFLMHSLTHLLLGLQCHECYVIHYSTVSLEILNFFHCIFFLRLDNFCCSVLSLIDSLVCPLHSALVPIHWSFCVAFLIFSSRTSILVFFLPSISLLILCIYFPIFYIFLICFKHF